MLDGDNTVFTYCLYFNRYLMLIGGKDQVYMVDHDNTVFKYCVFQQVPDADRWERPSVHG